MQNFNRINRSGFFVTLMISFSISAYPQSPLKKIYKVPFDSSFCRIKKLDFKSNPTDRTLFFKSLSHCIESSNKWIYIKIHEQGAILCYEDSLHSKPIQLQKRRYFPFQKLDPEIEYFLKISNQDSFNEFLGIALFRKESSEPIDEAFLLKQSCKNK